MEDEKTVEVLTEEIDYTSAPQTEEQAKDAEVTNKARDYERELANQRPVLNADQMASLVAPRAHFERQVAVDAWFYTVSGVLNGTKIHGALFAGEIILVYAFSRREADDLANRGLRSTVEALFKEYDTRQLRGDDTPIMKGLVQEALGSKMRPSAPGAELASLPKLKAVMAHEIGGLPWKW